MAVPRASPGRSRSGRAARPRPRARAGHAAPPRHQVPRSENRPALRRRLDARRHHVPQPARELDGARPAHRRRGDAAAHLSRPPRPAVAARAREPRHPRLVVLPRLDRDRRPDRRREYLCRAAAAEPRSSVGRLQELRRLVSRAGAGGVFPALGPPVLGVAFRRHHRARPGAAGVGGGDGSALDRRRLVQRPLVAALDMDRGSGRRPRRPARRLPRPPPPDGARPPRPAGLRRRRSAAVAGAVVPADHRLHRPCQP